jgi:hypothetical protein
MRQLAYVVATSSADSSTNTTPPEFANPTGQQRDCRLRCDAQPGLRANRKHLPGGRAGSSGFARSDRSPAGHCHSPTREYRSPLVDAAHAFAAAERCAFTPGAVRGDQDGCTTRLVVRPVQPPGQRLDFQAAWPVGEAGRRVDLDSLQVARQTGPDRVEPSLADSKFRRTWLSQAVYAPCAPVRAPALQLRHASTPPSFPDEAVSSGSERSRPVQAEAAANRERPRVETAASRFSLKRSTEVLEFGSARRVGVEQAGEPVARMVVVSDVLVQSCRDDPPCPVRDAD